MKSLTSNNSLINIKESRSSVKRINNLSNRIKSLQNDIDRINKRYDMIDKLRSEFILKEELARDLDEVYDLERLCGKTINGNLNARDVLQIKRSLAVLPSISSKTKELGFDYSLNDESKLYNLLETSFGFILCEGFILLLLLLSENFFKSSKSFFLFFSLISKIFGLLRRL